MCDSPELPPQLDAKDTDGPLDEQVAYACRFVARNQRIEESKTVLDRCSIPEEIETPRLTLMDRRGEGVPAILTHSRRLSGKQPVYELFGEELRLPIFAAGGGEAMPRVNNHRGLAAGLTILDGWLDRDCQVGHIV